MGLLGQVEGAAGAGEPVRALGEEVVGAVAFAEVVVLPRLPGRGGAGQDGLAVDEDFDGKPVLDQEVINDRAAITYCWIVAFARPVLDPRCTSCAPRGSGR